MADETILGGRPRVIKLSDARNARKKRRGEGPSVGKQRIVLAMCLECSTRWFGAVFPDVCLLCLECPSCHEQNSFGSFIPSNYFDTKMDHQHVYKRRNRSEEDDGD